MLMKSYGFSLIELMIVVAIIGILAMTAVPLYHGYVNEAARSEAKTTLADIASKEEAYFSSWGAYKSVNGTQSDYPNALQAQSAGLRSPQVSTDTGWNALGFNINGDGGLWNGPVYFRYTVVTGTRNGKANQTYRVCAHRWVSASEQEMLSLNNDNRRAYPQTTSSDCTAPGDS